MIARKSHVYADDALVFLNIGFVEKLSEKRWKTQMFVKVIPMSLSLHSQPLHTSKHVESFFFFKKLFSVVKIWCKIYILQTPLGLDYKDCLIIKNEHYSLPGVQKTFSSLTELTSYYQHNKLLLADVPVKLACCCPPRPKGVFLMPWLCWYYQMSTTTYIQWRWVSFLFMLLSQVMLWFSSTMDIWLPKCVTLVACLMSF